MDKKTWDEILDSKPTKLEVLHKMQAPNEDIEIYTGTLYVKFKGTIFIYEEGRVVLKWKPNHQYLFIFANKGEFWQHDINTNEFEVGINGIDYQKALFYSEGEYYTLSAKKVEIGIRPKLYKFTSFDLPNCNSLIGEVVRSGRKLASERFTIKTEKVVITIDVVDEISEIMRILRYREGIMVNARCKINFRRNASFDRMTSESYCFNYFISFILGRWTSSFCLEVEDKYKLYYSPYIQAFQYHSYKFSPNFIDGGLDEAYSKFAKLWSNQFYRTFLKKVIEWYTEISIKQVQHEIGIIMGQATLEFIYNYIIKEDLNKLGSETKIRRVLDHFKVNLILPSKYNFIVNKYFRETKVVDGAYLICSFRNAFVHGNPKLSHLRSAKSKVIYLVYDLVTAYIEQIIIKVLDIKLEYHWRLKEFEK